VLLDPDDRPTSLDPDEEEDPYEDEADARTVSMSSRWSSTLRRT